VEYLAYFDSLTGLPNRTLLKDRLNSALAAARRHEEKVAILFSIWTVSKSSMIPWGTRLETCF